MNVNNKVKKANMKVYRVNLAAFVTGTKLLQPVEQFEQVFVVSNSQPTEKQILEQILSGNLLFGNGVANWLSGDVDADDMAIEHDFDDVKFAYTVESINPITVDPEQLYAYINMLGIKQPVIELSKHELRHFHVDVSCYVKDFFGEHDHLVMSAYSVPELLFNFFNYMWWHYNSDGEQMADQLDESFGLEYLEEGITEWQSFLKSGTFAMPYSVNGESCKMLITPQFTGVDQKFVDSVLEVKKISNAIYILNEYDYGHPADVIWIEVPKEDEHPLIGSNWLKI